MSYRIRSFALCLMIVLSMTVTASVAAKAQPNSFDISGAWHIQFVDSVGIANSFTSIALDSKGKTHMSYCDLSDLTGHLRYATNSGGSWAATTVDGADGVGSQSSIAVDSNDKVHIAYFDNDNQALKYATNAGGSWALTTVDSDGQVGGSPSIALDSNDKVHIGYDEFIVESSLNHLKYATNARGSWMKMTVESSGGVKIGHIALDSLDNVYISYLFHSSSFLLYDYLKYATTVGGSWKLVQVDSSGPFAGSPDIAIDSNNRIHFTFSKAIGPVGNIEDMSSQLGYATNAGGQWINHTIDSDGSVGSQSSIAVDSNNFVHISYYDDKNTTLKYAKIMGALWSSMIIDSSGIVGPYSSIAVDSNDKIHISYLDSGNANVKYATNSAVANDLGSLSPIALIGIVAVIVAIILIVITILIRTGRIKLR